MSTDIVKYAFIAGELSPTLYGRTDLTKFDLGMAEAKNFFVDYRGGLSTRPGTRYMEHVYLDTENTRMVPFKFSPDVEDNHIILFGDEYIRFLQEGNYILEDPVACTVNTDTPAVVTAVAHGYSNNRWIKAGGKTYQILDVTADTFTLHSVPNGELVDGTGLTFTTFQAIYEIASPYAASDLDGLKFDQYRDRILITSKDFAPRNLIREGAVDWSIEEVSISPYSVGPTITGETISAAGDAQTIFAVTKVLEDGSESVIGQPYRLDNMVNYPVTEGSVSVTWAASAEAQYYNVYRSIVSVSEVLSLGSELGYAGRTHGTKFTDPNIVPDFGRSPPSNYNPFAPGAITSVEVTSGGSGYTSAPTVTAAGGGTNFAARAIINDAGEVVNVVLLNGGTGYTSPTISFSGGGGTGAAATATARALTGVYPRLSAIFQQRQIYAASEEYPITIWGSQTKRFNNFNYSDILVDSDSFEFDLDTSAISPIQHLFPTRGGLLAMTQENIWLITGGGTGDSPVTATSVLADPQTYTGVSSLEPLRIASSLLYTEGKGYAVRSLSYNELSRIYAGTDKSVLSSHLFGLNKQIVRWAFQESPYKVVWCIREDGALLAYTTVEEEEVFAWTPCHTQGKFTDVCTIREGNEDRVYFTVERFINGRWSKFIERMDFRQFVNVEDAWCVDCGLSLDSTTPDGTITIHYSNETYTATIEGSVWGEVEGKILRAGNGIFEIISAVSTTVTLKLRKSPDNWVPETDNAYTFPVQSGDWALDDEVTEISGLDHLEGETVSILGDGNVFPRSVVTNGTVTLPNAASKITIGLRFTCKAKTLPLIVPDAGIEAKRKRVVAVAVRLQNSRALKVGDSYDTVYEFPERSTEDWGLPIELQNGIEQMPIGTTWDEESYTYFLLDDPLPATLLSLVQEVEVGDEPD